MANYIVAEHRFAPGQTIEAVIRLVNYQTMTKDMSNMLLNDYYKINGNVPPRVGQVVFIPVFPGFVGLNVKYKTTTIEVKD